MIKNRLKCSKKIRLFVLDYPRTLCWCLNEMSSRKCPQIRFLKWTGVIFTEYFIGLLSLTGAWVSDTCTVLAFYYEKQLLANLRKLKTHFARLRFA